MIYDDDLRAFWATLATRGWRNYLTWGVTTLLLLLGLGFVVRFWMGTVNGQDFVALAGIVIPYVYQQYCRNVEKRDGVADRPSVPLVNPAALA